MLIRIDHPDVTGQPSTSLRAAAAVATTSLNLRSDFGLAANDYLVLGGFGQESAEIVKIVSLDGSNNITVTPGLKLAKTLDTPATRTPYNQIKIYKSSTLTGTYSALATVGIAADASKTPYDHSAGLTTDYYKISYYNAQNAVETALSAPIGSGGYTWDSLKSMVDRVLTIFPDKEQRILYEGDVITWLNEVYEEQFRGLQMLDKDYCVVSLAAQPLINAQQEYDLPADCTFVKRLEVAYDSLNYVQATPERHNQGSRFAGDEISAATGALYPTSAPSYYVLGDKFGLRPVPDSAGLYSIWYETVFTPLVNPTDEPVRALRPYTGALVEYAKSRGYYSFGEDEKGKAGKEAADVLLNKMMSELSLSRKDGNGAEDMFRNIEL